MSATEPSAAYDIEQAAAWLKVTPTWLASQARRGLVPHSRLGRRRVFTEADLQRILAQNRADATSGLTEGSIARVRRRRAAV